MVSLMKGERSDEQGLFEEAMADVAPVEKDRSAPAAADPPITSPQDRDREARREFERVASGEAPLETPDDTHGLDPAESFEGKVTGLDPRVLGQLRRGEFSMQDEVDLHRLNAEDARETLDRFLAGAQARGLRCVRIIHGWGKGSPGGFPVLKPSLPRWLERGEIGKRVLAYATEPGNPGATCVLLRGGAPTPGEPRRRRRGRRR